MAETSDDDRHEAAATSDDMSVPASIRAAWGQHARPSRGPKPGLSLERIVAAGIAVADAEGLAAVSMGRVAAELGSSAMSLYRYVSAKDELLALMVDTAMGAPAPPPAGSAGNAGWREGLGRWAVAGLDAYLSAIWIARAPIPGPPITPNQIRWMEAGLTCLRETGLTEQEKLSTILLLSGLARNYASLWADIVDAVRAAGGRDLSADYARGVLHLAPADEFPAVHAAIRSGSLEDDDEDFAHTEMAFAVERVLDGLEVLVRRRELGSTAEVSSAADDGPTDPAAAAHR